MSKKILQCLAVVLAFVLTFSLPATASAATGKITKTVDGTKVTLILPTEKGVIGDNDIKITLVTKTTKKVVTSSKVKVVVEMDSESMGSMDMGMNEAKTVTFKESKTKGEYTGKVNFTDEGDWKLKVTFTTGTGKKAKTHTTTFLVTAKESN